MELVKSTPQSRERLKLAIKSGELPSVIPPAPLPGAYMTPLINHASNVATYLHQCAAPPFDVLASFNFLCDALSIPYAYIAFDYDKGAEINRTFQEAFSSLYHRAKNRKEDEL